MNEILKLLNTDEEQETVAVERLRDLIDLAEEIAAHHLDHERRCPMVFHSAAECTCVRGRLLFLLGDLGRCP